MTTPTSTSSHGARETFDTGPLSWVMGEIRESLNRSKTSVQEAVAQDTETQATAIRHAKSYLHQAHGALQIVDVDGVAIITETVEDLLDRVDAGQLTLSAALAQAIATGYQALTEYLDELLAGMLHQPVRLFPYYRALLEVRGAERIHPADLFFPNLAVRPKMPVPASVEEVKPTRYVVLRQRFEKALLPFLKSSERGAELANAAVMRDIVGEIEGLQANQQIRAFWWVLHGLTEAVAGGQIENEIYVKQLFARINLMIRRLCQGSSSIAERLLRDALFFIAKAKDPSPRVREIRRVYQLDGLVPEDYDRKRYGQIDGDALALAKDRLSQAKTIWNRIVGGDVSVAESFEHEMRVLADAGSRLNSPPLTKLLRELKGIARHAVHAKPGDILGLEMATSLLFVENSLNQIGRLPENFTERADAMTARLLAVVTGEQPAQSMPWLDDMSREAQQRQTMAALAGEMQNSLRQVEKMLDEYFRDPAQRNALGQLDHVLHQIEGAMAVLDQDDAMRTIQHTRKTVQNFLGSEEGTPAIEDFQHVAQNVGALSFFIETLQHQPDSAKDRFSFDEGQGLFRANLIEPGSTDDPEINEPVVTDFSAGEAETSAESASPAEVASVQTVEDELAFHQQQSAELAMSLSAQPNNHALQEQLKESLEKIRQDATLVDNPEANDRAQAGIDILKREDFSSSSEALAEIITATVPALQAVEVLLPMVAPTSDEAIDAELLEIFLLEAEEVLGTVSQTLPDSRNQPHNQEHLTTLRRSFHTLKGSGRMVGLVAFGEAAWSIEQVLNLRLSESRGGDHELYALLDKAVVVLGDWVQDLTHTGRSDRTPDALVKAAERVKEGGQFVYEEAASDVPVAVITEPRPEGTVTAADAAPQLAAETANAGIEEPAAEQVADATPAPFSSEFDLLAPLPQTLKQETGEVSFSEAEAEAVASSDLPEVEELQMSDADMAMFAVPGSRDELIASANEQSASNNLPALDMVTGDTNAANLGDIAEAPAPAAVVEFVEPAADVDTINVGEVTETDNAVDASDAVEALTQDRIDADLLADVQLLSEEEFAQQDVLPEAVGRSEPEAVDEQAETARLTPSPATPAIAEVIEFPTMHAPEARVNDNVKRIGGLEISVPLHNIYLAETDELVRVLAHDISEWRHEPDREVSVQSVHAAHSLAGSSATVGFMSLHEVAHALEKVLQLLMRRPVYLQLHEYDTLEQTIERLKAMLQKFALGEMPADEPHYVRVLDNLRRDIELRSQMAELSDMQDLPSTSRNVLPAAEPELPHANTIAEDISALEDSDGALVPELDHLIDSVVDMQPAATQDVSTVAASAQPVAPSAGTIPDSELATDPSLAIRDELDADLLPVFLEEGRDMFPQMGTALRGWQEQGSSIAAPQSVLRLLHTLKGSARMAGAMNLGQHLHDMETRIENIMHLGTPEPLALEDLLVRYDQAQHMFELLQNPSAAVSADTPVDDAQVQDVTEVAAAHAVSPGPVVLSPLMPVPSVRPATDAPLASRAGATSAAVPAPLVRVRADILDRLVNQAGEVSISRSKLETEVGTLKQSLSELTDNVSRLRDQLREIEMQAETQITSRMAHSADREFDPLEFDRFTRLQELTRMMAESVNDVGSVHQNLSRTLDSAVDDLSTQARLTRDLQQDLMRVRMVQFASISERLFRVTRQAAKEVDKRVNLDIRGSAVEIDRGVLEKMTGPFEHLLRNAIVHGVETRDARRAAGKNETGELLVEVRQEGNEVVIQFSDDGQGLNLGRIRDKAERIGLLTNEAPLSDDEVTDLIFHPGFSTAEEITELAGRGVGMDVVRSEAAALGGRVTTWTESGKGTQFTIRLPLTLAVTQVVLISTGGLTYAVPSVLVEQVQQLKTNALAAAYNEGAVIWQGQRVPMHYLSSLLGNKQASPVSQHYSPLLILKSGNDRVAVHVDEIMGNREVVVKNIGPQLSRMIGIAGATVLGSGDIVLILNPVPLAQRAAQESLRAPRITASDAPEVMGAVAEMAAHEPSSPKSGPVQGLRTQNIVMVVDDSLTVRRVTQRLLTREGYQVVLAKDGVDALEHLQSITPDVMLVDIEMPRMDGFDLTRNVRGDERTRHIPIIMITSRTAGKHRNYALELGVNEYLGKPYQEDQLLGLIAGFVKKEATVS